MDLTTGGPPDKKLPTVTSEYAVDLQECLMEVHHQMLSHLRLVEKAMKRQYDQCLKEQGFVESLRVWFSKAAESEEGTCTVVEHVSDITAEKVPH